MRERGGIRHLFFLAYAAGFLSLLTQQVSDPEEEVKRAVFKEQWGEQEALEEQAKLAAIELQEAEWRGDNDEDDHQYRDPEMHLRGGTRHLLQALRPRPQCRFRFLLP